MKTIRKSIEISAPKQNVWHVLLNDQLTRVWYAVFSEGTHAQTDWQVGSKVVFADGSESGMIAKVIANQPNELLSVEYQGQIIKGKEDYESEEARQMLGGRETYHLSEKAGHTLLAIECDMGEPHVESMSEAWDKALQKIKELAESEPVSERQNG